MQVSTLSYMVFTLLVLLVPVQGNCEWYDDFWNGMGTRMSVEFYAENESVAKTAIQYAKTEFDRIEQMMTAYQPNSELMRINAKGFVRPLKLSEELNYVIKRSLYFSGLTNGAFDITYASVGYRYDLRNKITPTDLEIQSLLPSINYRFVELHDDGFIRLRNADTKLDLGGIAKGYAVDMVAKGFLALGIKHAVITAGGDSRLLGDKKGRPWMIGIKDPRNPDAIAVTLPLNNVAVSTSGDYERFFIADGKRYHHIINPLTGKSAADVQSVTIVGNDATTTDALSTSVFVMGVDKGLKLVESLPDIDVIIVDNHRKMHFSSGLSAPQ